MSSDLTTFLRERLDEDEQTASAASDGPWTAWRESRLRGLGELQHMVMLPGQKPGSRASIATASWLDAEHIARHDPARTLREVEAKRRLLERHKPVTLRRRVADQMADVVACEYDTDPDGMGWLDHPCETLRILAAVYANHPDYREEWRP